jgi:hypothetical protein
MFGESETLWKWIMRLIGGRDEFEVCLEKIGLYYAYVEKGKVQNRNSLLIHLHFTQLQFEKVDYENVIRLLVQVYYNRRHG